MSAIVLIVDDDPFIRRLIATTLEDVAGFNIEEAGDGVEAVATARAKRPALVFLDIDMPRMNGIEAACAIRQALGELTPALIAVSGNIDRIDLASTVFGHVLHKPVDADRLLTILRSAPPHH